MEKDNNRKFINAILKIYPNAEFVHMKETKRSRYVARVVRKYIMEIEHGSGNPARSTLKFKAGVQ